MKSEEYLKLEQDIIDLLTGFSLEDFRSNYLGLVAKLTIDPKTSERYLEWKCYKLNQNKPELQDLHGFLESCKKHCVRLLLVESMLEKLSQKSPQVKNIINEYDVREAY